MYNSASEHVQEHPLFAHEMENVSKKALFLHMFSLNKLNVMYKIPSLPLEQNLDTVAILKQLNKANRKLAELKGVALTVSIRTNTHFTPWGLVVDLRQQ